MDLKASVLEDIKARIKQELEQYKKQIKNQLADEEQRVDAFVEREKQRINQEADMQKQRIISDARVEARKQITAQKRAIIERIAEEVAKKTKQDKDEVLAFIERHPELLKGLFND